jgi:hypothetical protein
MARTCRTTRKSTGRLPVGYLAPQNVPQPQEFQPDLPQEASSEELPFKIELVVPESPTAQDTPAEEQPQPEDHNTEDKTNEEHPPPRDTEDEKMFRDADEVESFGAESSILASTRDQPSGFHTMMLLLMPPGKPSHRGSVATRAGCRTRSTTSYPTGRRINSRPMG